MKKTLSLLKVNKKYIFILILISIICLLFLFFQYKKPSQYSGGSGVSEQKILIFKGWENKNQFNISIGETITLKQQKYIEKIIKQNTKNIKKAVIQKEIIGNYDKINNIDKNTFYIKAGNKKFKIIINYIDETVKIYLDNILVK